VTLSDHREAWEAGFREARAAIERAWRQYAFVSERARQAFEDGFASAVRSPVRRDPAGPARSE
jgi:hypothetical protein